MLVSYLVRDDVKFVGKGKGCEVERAITSYTEKRQGMNFLPKGMIGQLFFTSKYNILFINFWKKKGRGGKIS